MVRFACALGQLPNLRILDRDLSAQKFHFAFEADDIARLRRVLSRQVGAGRWVSWRHIILICPSDSLDAKRSSYCLAAVRGP